MIYTTLISPSELHTLILNHKASQEDNLLIIDCQCNLTDRTVGKRNYDSAHIPESFFIDFDEVVSGKASLGTGRHPLPDRQAFVDEMQKLGVGNNRQVIVYDQGGLGFAPRLWWQLRWAGYEKVAVLDGGFKAWNNGWRPTSTEIPSAKTKGNWDSSVFLETPVEMLSLQRNLTEKNYLVIDARPTARFHGENETLDHKAGHIPGSLTRSASLNLDETGKFKPAPTLRKEWLDLIGSWQVDQVVNSCGSGVNACANLLAMAYCGLHGAKLYPGSWSQWIDDPSNPIEVP